MASILPPDFESLKSAMGTTQINPGLEEQAQDIAYDIMELSGEGKLNLIKEALELYPLSTETWSELGYYYMNSGSESNLPLGIQAFETAIAAARRSRPSLGPERTKELEWGYLENRPYIRAMRGHALCCAKAGDLNSAIDTAALLSKWGHTVLDGQLAGWYLRLGRNRDAEILLHRHIDICKQEERIFECDVAYSWLLLNFIRWNDVSPRSNEREEQLEEALGMALKCNIYVPDLLLAPTPPSAELPSSYSYGNPDQALLYAIDSYGLWRIVGPGALDFLRSAKIRAGVKPDEETLVQFLSKESVLLHLNDNTLMEATRNPSRMIGTAVEGFIMRPECVQPHINGTPIWVQKKAFDVRLEDCWVQLDYDNIKAVPFWDILLKQSILEEEHARKEEEKKIAAEAAAAELAAARRCFQCNAPEISGVRLLRCSRCKYATYCSRDCQRLQWKQHKKECENFLQSRVWGELDLKSISVIASFLNLREKSMVCSFNKRWLEAVTISKDVIIDPDEDRIFNINGALNFVGNRFNHLQNFSLHVGQGYFLNHNEELLDDDDNERTLQLNGGALKAFFEDRPCLHSIELIFGECVERFTSQILVEEQGLSSLHQQTSLQCLRLYQAYFESMASLTQTLGHLTKLISLTLDIVFPSSEHIASDTSFEWISSSSLMSTIGTQLPHLRRLRITNHKLEDGDLQALSPICPQLQGLELPGQFGGFDPRISLTDASLQFIGRNCPKLQVFDIAYNRDVTFEGMRTVIQGCPLLRELIASEVGLNSGHLEEVVNALPNLRLVHFGSFHQMDQEDDLRKAAIASHGRVLFIACTTGQYQPNFDSDLMENQRETRKKIQRLNANESNGWNEWDDYFE